MCLQDYHGDKFDRDVCFDESASVIVRSVDTCACTYAENPESSEFSASVKVQECLSLLFSGCVLINCN